MSKTIATHSAMSLESTENDDTQLSVQWIDNSYADTAPLSIENRRNGAECSEYYSSPEVLYLINIFVYAQAQKKSPKQEPAM